MKDLLKHLWFTPKENTAHIYSKKYPLFWGYEVCVDFQNEIIDYGSKIKSERDTTRNFFQEENWVVLECVNRLLEKWYKPEDIILEKKFTVGHGAAGGWLDILVRKEGKAYIMIECKTWGKEFEKEWQNTQKKWGQLLSYLQQDRDAEFLVLYASQFEKWEVIYKNEIIKIEEDYRLMSNVEELYARWNKFSKQNGIFESWTIAYHFESKALTLGDLKEIRQEDSSFIFNRFLEILRHNAVSDKPNAFNKIFTLFLCKIKDEDKQPTEELDFQWKEGEDDSISFQKRLSDLYKKWMLDFLNKTISDLSDKDFNGKYSHLSDWDRQSILHEITRIRLQKNNEFAIKEVFDEETFEENSKVLKEVVELLQEFRFRYAKKQPFLGDFFELLLTTGLKQEAWQFFTPVPIARFISKSVPMRSMLEKKLRSWNKDELLPNIIDYAAWSGHFLTESMEELQNILASLDLTQFPPSVQKEVKPWQQDNPFAWAYNYIYGIELDYRLVKTTKVGCYLHGDGIANVIHGDGLDSFTDGNYLWKLKKTISGTQDNGQFDFVLANPPYSVSACKGNLKNKNAKTDFTLYDSLTDQSSQIESLFIERTKQLLAEGGVAAIILPSSILSNTGIYTKTREILLKYFEFIAITELWSGTFMATGTNTVILFLRRRNNYDSVHTSDSVKNFFTHHKDNTIQSIESPIAKYISHVWQSITLEDYISMISGAPTEVIKKHEIYIEYEKKIKAKNPKEWLEIVRTTEQDKILYFLLAYGQKVVLIKSWDKQDEKNFLGYEFSNRKGDEGIHAIRRGKQIDECTLLFHPDEAESPERVNTYILDAFAGKHDRAIVANLEKYITRIDLIDMLSFDRAEFEKNISLSVKKKLKIESKWEMIKIGEVVKIINGYAFESANYQDKGLRVIRITNVQKGVIVDNDTKFHPENKEFWGFELSENDLLMSLTGNVGRVWLFPKEFLPAYLNQRVAKLVPNKKILRQYLFSILNTDICEQIIINAASGLAQKNLSTEWLKDFQIPLPPLDIQEQIVWEMEEVEKREEKMKTKISELKNTIESLFEGAYSKANTTFRLSDHDIFDVSIGQRVLKNEFVADGEIPVYSANVMEPFWYIDELLIKNFDTPSVLWGIDGDWMVNCLSAGIEFYPTDHCGVLRVKNRAINERYLAYVLKKEWEKVEFSRQKRASIEKIQGIKISVPSLSEQQKIVAEIEKIEAEIAGIEAELAGIPEEKDAILKKYL